MLCDGLSASLWGFLWNLSKWLTMLLFFLHRVGILVSPWPAKNIIHYFTNMHSLYLPSDFSYFFSIQFSHVSSKYAQYFLQLINMLLLRCWFFAINQHVPR
jgi:hypothetical protein